MRDICKHITPLLIADLQSLGHRIETSHERVNLRWSFLFNAYGIVTICHSIRRIQQLIQGCEHSAQTTRAPTDCENQQDKPEKGKRENIIRPVKRRGPLKVKERCKNESHDSQQTHECQKRKPKEETSHSAKEWVAAHIPPALRRPFFIFRPPGRALAMGKTMIRFHLSTNL